MYKVGIYYVQVNNTSEVIMSPVPEQASVTMTIDDAAKLLGIGRNQAYAAARRGDLPILKLGARYLVLREPLERMLRGETAKKAAA
jgi:excisionase family DNA binding protein